MLDRLAEALIEHETLDGDSLEEILAGVGAGAPVDAATFGPTGPGLSAPLGADQMRAEGTEQ